MDDVLYLKMPQNEYFSRSIFDPTLTRKEGNDEKKEIRCAQLQCR